MCTANQRICLGCSSNLLTLLRRSAAVAQWFQMAKNPPKNKFNQSDFTSFSIQVSAYSHNFHFRSLSALHFQNLSNRCRHKYDPSISRIFWISFLAGFCNLVQLCGWDTWRELVAKRQKPAENEIQKIREIDGSYLCLQQFDKFSIRSASNNRKRKLCEFDDSCLEKLVKSLQVN